MSPPGEGTTFFVFRADAVPCRIRIVLYTVKYILSKYSILSIPHTASEIQSFSICRRCFCHRWHIGENRSASRPGCFLCDGFFAFSVKDTKNNGNCRNDGGRKNMGEMAGHERANFSQRRTTPSQLYVCTSEVCVMKISNLSFFHDFPRSKCIFYRRPFA